MSKNNATNNLFLNQPLVQTATNYTALATDVIIEVTSTAAIRTITLPAPSAAASTSNVGKFYVIKDTSGAAATNNIFVVPASGTIDGSGSLVIGTNYGAVQVYSDGTNYYSQALVTPPLTGIPLANFGYSLFNSSLFAPGTTVAQVNFPPWASTIGNSGSRINITALNVVNPPTNITVNAQNITITQAGRYSLNLTSCFGGIFYPAIQLIKNNTTMLFANIGYNNAVGYVTHVDINYTGNFVASDTIDFRVINTSNGSSTFYALSIFVNQIPTTY